MQHAETEPAPENASLPEANGMYSMKTMHIYNRQVNPATEDSIAKVVRIIRPGSTVLDVGAATGALGRYLASAKACVIDGVEYNPYAAEQGQAAYRTLQVCDLESTDLRTIFPHHAYDFIVCADILEHLHKPGNVIQQFPQLLAEGGKLIISIPNVGYLGLIAEILSGEFRYREEGLLDNTHVRFFTNASLRRMLHANGFRVLSIDAVTKELQESEFAPVSLETLPPLLRQQLVTLPNTKAYQFIVEAEPGTGPDLDEGTAAIPGSSEWYITSTLHWRAATTPFQNADYVTSRCHIGGDRCHLTFTLPYLGERIAQLRIDLADRPGYMCIYAMQLINGHTNHVIYNGHVNGDDQGGQGEILWQWDGAHSDLVAHALAREIFFAPLSGPDRGVIAFLTGKESQLLLPIPESTLARITPGALLTIQARWPMPDDFTAITASLEALLTASEAETHDSNGHASSPFALDAMSHSLVDAMPAIAASSISWDKSEDKRDVLIERLIVRMQEYEQRVDSLSAELAHRNQEIIRLRAQATAPEALGQPTRHSQGYEPENGDVKRVPQAHTRRAPSFAKRAAKAVIRRTPILRRRISSPVLPTAAALMPGQFPTPASEPNVPQPQTDEQVISDSGLFDTAFYLQRNPDIAETKQDPLTHFLTHGAFERRNPNPIFDVAYYLNTYPDVEESGINPLVHYIKYGAREGRNPNPIFETTFYLKENPDVAAADINPLMHYITHGAREGRRPSPLFDAATVLRAMSEMS